MSDMLYQLSPWLGLIIAGGLVAWAAQTVAKSNAGSEAMWREVERIHNSTGSAEAAYAHMEARYGKDWSAPAKRYRRYVERRP